MGGIGFGQCEQKRTDCFAYVSGKCRVLVDGDFGDRQCPFYKHKTDKNAPTLGEENNDD